MKTVEESVQYALKTPELFWNEFLKHIEDMDDDALVFHRHWVNTLAGVVNGRVYWKNIPPERRPRMPLWDDIKAKR